MVQVASSLKARAVRVPRESESGSGARYFRCDFFAPPEFSVKLDHAQRMALYERCKGRAETPHAFTVEDQTGGPIPSHFHRVPQFQVITAGEGRLGRHEVRGVAVHYTDPYTAYGPIVPGAGGLSYFTLRMQFDPGANYLDKPGVRELLRPSRKRFLLIGADRVAVSAPQALAARRETALDTLIAPHDDGVAVWVLRLGPGARGACPDPSDCGGQYVIVVNGSLLRDGESLPWLSCLFVSRDEPPLALEAGAQGLEALVLQFPRVTQ
jgi:hypothetical protein